MIPPAAVVKAQRIGRRIFAIDSNDSVCFLHLLISAFFFSPFFIFSRVAIYNTDVVNLNLPLLFFAKHNFLSGHLGLWNPYLLAGTSAFSTSNLPVLSPDNWPHFLVPDQYFLHAATFYGFIKLWLVGALSFPVFNQELGSRKWAFFCSIVYQMCGYSLWSLGVYDVLSMLVFMTAAYYVIWTLHRRPAHLNYAYLSIVLVLDLFSTNISYAAYSIVAVGVAFLYRYFSQLKTTSRLHHLVSFTLAGFTMIAVGLMRLLPVWIETHQSNRTFGFNPDFADPVFLALRLFDPEVLGVNFNSSIPVIAELTPLMAGMHIQAAMPHYFGVLPALLVVWAVISPQQGRINFWTFYVLTILFLVLRIEPFDTMFRFLNPAYHTLSVHSFLPLGFCMLAGHAAKSLEERGHSLTLSPKLVQALGFILVIITLYILDVWIVNFETSLPVMRAVALAVILSGVLVAAACRYWPRAVSRGCALAGGAMFVAFLYLLIVYDNPNRTFQSHVKNIAASIVLLMITGAYLWSVALGSTHWRRAILFAGASLAAICLIVTIYPWTDAVRELPSKEQDFLVAGLGFVRFAIVAVIFLMGLFFLRRRRIDSSLLFPVFLAVVVFELLPAGKVHSHLVFNMFYNRSSPYVSQPRDDVDTAGQPITLDLKNYRVNNPNTMMGLPIYDQLYGPGNEILSSAFAMHGIRSYGGHYNVVSRRYEQFIRGIEADVPIGDIGYGLYARRTSGRLLDLLGVRYDYRPPDSTRYVRVIVERHNALPRFSLFTSFEVIADEGQALARLKRPEFDPTAAVILGRDPRIPSSTAPVRFRMLEFTERSTDEIEVDVPSGPQAVLLFNDSFHEGWQAYVNGRNVAIIPANHNFMAVPVPAGGSKVVFRFEPPLFTGGLYLAAGGALLFVGVTCVLYIFRRRLGAVATPGDGTREPATLQGRSPWWRLTAVTLVVLTTVATIQGLRRDGGVDLYWRLTASSQQDPHQGPEGLMEGSTIWHARRNPQFPEWVMAQLDEPRRLSRLAMQAQEGSDAFKRAPKDFILQGSMDQRRWNDLLTVRSEKYTRSGEWKAWSFDTDRAYLYYRIYITGNSGEPSLLTIARLRLE